MVHKNCPHVTFCHPCCPFKDKVKLETCNLEDSIKKTVTWVTTVLF